MVFVVNHTKISLLFDKRLKDSAQRPFFRDISLQSRQLARTARTSGMMNVVKLNHL